MLVDEGMTDRLFSDGDDDEELGFGAGGGRSRSYDDDEDEEGGWSVAKDQSDSIWDSTDQSDDDEEEGGVAPLAEGSEDDEEGDLFGEPPAPRRRGRKPAEKPRVKSIFEMMDETGEHPIPEPAPAAAGRR